MSESGEAVRRSRLHGGFCARRARPAGVRGGACAVVAAGLAALSVNCVGQGDASPLEALDAAVYRLEVPSFHVAWAESDSSPQLELRGLEPDVAVLLREAPPIRRAPTFDEAKTGVAVYVGRDVEPGRRSFAVTLCAAADETTLRIVPRHAWKPGQTYTVTAYVRHVDGEEWRVQRKSTSVQVPMVEAEPVTVTGVYPSGSLLPENQLRFYVDFSGPMARGEAYRRVALKSASGESVEGVFLELGEELWSPDQTRLTLFLDPARVKQGLVPHEIEGPALVEGQKYTVEVSAQWTTAAGSRLGQGFTKAFAVSARDDRQPSMESWQLQTLADRSRLPRAGTREPLMVRFAEPLDWGMLHRVLSVEDAGGVGVEGHVDVTDGETVWLFTPQRPWVAGEHQLAVSDLLEDRAGNSLQRRFERDVFDHVESPIPETVLRRSFTLVAAPLID